MSIVVRSPKPAAPEISVHGERLVAAAFDPARRENIASVFFTSALDVPAVVARARKAALRWDGLSPERRSAVLATLRELIAQRRAIFAETIALSMGKPLLEALLYDVAPVLRLLAECVERPPVPATAAPAVVSVIASIGLPFERALTPAIMALAEGSAVIIKPASSAPLVGAMIARLFDDAFDEFPGLAQVVQGDAQLASQLATAEDVDRVDFSGLRTNALRLRATLEPLGRPARMQPLAVVPLIVCDDANLERVANAAVFGRFCNNGQGGGSINRAYVHQSLAAEFEHKVVHKVRALKAGPYVDHHCELGPLANGRGLPHMRAVMQDAIDHRATILTGGVPPRLTDALHGERLPPSGQGLYWPATVLANVAPSTRLMREETFGPILAITAVQDDREAIALANDTATGFGACVFSSDQEHAGRVAGSLQARLIAVNDVLLQPGGRGGHWEGDPASRGGASDLHHSGNEQKRRVGDGDADRDPAWFPYSPAKLDAAQRVVARLAARGNRVLLDLAGSDG